MDRFKNFPSASSVKKERLIELVNGFSNSKIAVLGDLGIDKYTIGDVSRISPEAPVPVLHVEEESRKLGLAANVAENLKTLDSKAVLVGVCGNDRNSSDLFSLLDGAEIEKSYIIQDPGRPTSFKERVVARGQQVVRVDYESREELSGETLKRVNSVLDDIVERDAPAAVIVEDYRKGLVTKELVKNLTEKASPKGIRVGMDPHRDAELSDYYGVNFLTPNLPEAEALCGHQIKNEDDLMRAGKHLLDKTGAEYALITLGSEGMAFFEGSRVGRIPTFAREVYDVSGAGDTAIAVITLSLCAGASIEEAITLANLASGVVVGKAGTATVTSGELLPEIEKLYK
jgi:rfaE bifunctional protein kinase chain/domain